MIDTSMIVKDWIFKWNDLNISNFRNEFDLSTGTITMPEGEMNLTVISRMQNSILLAYF